MWWELIFLSSMLKILPMAAAFRTAILEIKVLFLSWPCSEVWSFLKKTFQYFYPNWNDLASFTRFVSEWLPLKKKKSNSSLFHEDFLAVIFLKMPHKLFNLDKSFLKGFPQGHHRKSMKAASRGDVSFPECQVKNKTKSSM